MSQMLDFLKSRRSSRRYEDRPIPDEVLEKVLEAVRWSQSWANTQCWEVIVVKDPDTRLRLQAILSPRNPSTRALVDSSALLVLCAKKESSGYYDSKPSTIFGDWMLYDLGIATQSLCLVAHDLGLGTVVVGLFDHKEAAAILNTPDDIQPVSMIPIGYPSKTSSPPDRKAVSSFSYLDAYGKKLF